MDNSEIQSMYEIGYFRDNYPGVLNINFLKLFLYSLFIPDGIKYSRTLYSDIRLIKRKKFKVEGWRFKNNPYKNLRLNEFDDPNYKELEITHHHLYFANNWAEVGEWAASEKHYLITIDKSIRSNNIDAALMAGTNLAYCYLASRNNKSAFYLTNNLLEVPIDWFDPTTFQRISTIRQLIFVRTGNYADLENEIKRYKTAISTLDDYSGKDELDNEVYNRGLESYKFNRQSQNVLKWETEWYELEKIQSNPDVLHEAARTSIPKTNNPGVNNSRLPEKTDITSYNKTSDIFKSGKFNPDERRKEYRRRGKSPSGVIDGVYNDMNRENDAYNDADRDWDAGA